MGKIVFSINVSGKTVFPFEKKKKTTSTHISHNTKANFKRYTDQNKETKKLKLQNL